LTGVAFLTDFGFSARTLFLTGDGYFFAGETDFRTEDFLDCSYFITEDFLDYSLTGEILLRTDAGLGVTFFTGEIDFLADCCLTGDIDCFSDICFTGEIDFLTDSFLVGDTFRDGIFSSEL